MFSKFIVKFFDFRLASGLLLKNCGAYLILGIGTPLLTRAYDPSQFGTLSLLIFFGSLISLFSTLRLEIAIPITKSFFELIYLVFFTIISTLAITVIAVVLAITVYMVKTSTLPNQYFGNWFFGVPLMGLFLASVSIVNMTLLRVKKYGILGSLPLVQNLAFIFCAILLIPFDSEVNGLIIAKLFGVGMGLCVGLLIITNKRTIRLILWCFNRVSLFNFRYVCNQYIDFIKFNFPLSLFGVISRDVLILLAAAMQGVEYAGFYSLARVVQEIPLSLLSGSLGVVFFGEAAKGYVNRQVPNGIREQIQRIFSLFLYVAFPIYLFCTIWAVEIFSFVFGDQWSESGKFFLILLPLGLISLLSSWQVRIFEVTGKQKSLFRVQIGLECFGSIVAVLMYQQNQEFDLIIAVAVLFFTCVPIYVSMETLKAIGIAKIRVHLLGASMLLFCIGNSFILMGSMIVNADHIYPIWLMSWGILFGLAGWFCLNKTSPAS